MKRIAIIFAILMSFITQSLAQANHEAVKIGVLSDMSGGLADLAGPGSVEAVKMAVEDFGGTVLGRPIQVLSGDHQNKPDVALSIARQWYDVENVDVIADVLGSAVALAVQDLTRRKNRVLLITAGISEGLTNEACTPNSIAWIHDTYSTGYDAAAAIVKEGGDTWYFLTADYAFGHQLERTATEAVIKNGGKVLGEVRHPLLANDMSSFLLQAQTSGAKVIGLASGTDAVTVMKQARDFGVGPDLNGQRFALLYFSINDAHSLGIKALQGANVIDSFYWNQNEETRAWSKRFYERRHVMPSSIQAANYGAVLHYLRAVQAAGTDESGAVLKKMREIPINDFEMKNGYIRPDGRVMRDMYLYQVKTPEQSEGEWDLYNLVRTIPAESAFRSVNESKCPLLK